MKPIYINFAPSTFKRSLYLTSGINWLIGVIVLLVLLTGFVYVMALMQQYFIKADEQGIQVRREENVTLRNSHNKLIMSEAQKSSINSAIAQLNLPWRDLLDALESATPSNIALLSIEPESKKLIVKGMAEAKTSREMIDYIEMLKKQNFFRAVILIKHEINEQDSNRPYRFQFEAQWMGDFQINQ